MDDDLNRRLELLKQAMAEALNEPPARNAEQWFRYLMEKLEQRRKRNSNE